MPCPLEGHGQGALVPGTGAGLAARLDLAPLRQVAAQAIHIFVVNIGQLFGAEATDFAPGHEALFAARATRAHPPAAPPAATATIGGPRGPGSFVRRCSSISHG